MLPGPYRVWIANFHNLRGVQGANDICNQPVTRPVAPANYVSSSRRCQSHMMFSVGIRWKIRVAVSADDKLRACLAAAIRVVTAERVVFPIGPDPFAILVAFV